MRKIVVLALVSFVLMSFNNASNSTINKIEIIDIQGRLLKTIKENKEKYQIDISNFSSATYLVKLSTEKGSQTVKIVKK